MKSNINVVELSDDLLPEYERFLENHSSNLIYYSNNYRLFLKEIIKQVESKYFVAIRDERIVGILPCFINNVAGIGKVINSLPFFGSHGGVLVTKEENDNDWITKNLIEALENYIQANDIISVTIIENLFERADFNSIFRHDFKDYRIGQFTQFPEILDKANLDEELMKLFHSKTRNMIRKGLSNNFKIETSSTEEVFDFLVATHKENIKAIGGIPKERNVFNAIRKIFKYDKDYLIWVAKDGEKNIAALLLLYNGETVEYFTPCILAEYRNSQVLSALIFNAMKNALTRGVKLWNWGGTWSSQDGVYLFKSRWGTGETKYNYYIRLIKKDLLQKPRSYFQNNFEYFYVLPFRELAE